MSKRRGGFTLLTVMMVLLLVAVFALTITDLASFQIHAVQQRIDRYRAREAADAGLAAAIARLAQTPDFDATIKGSLAGGCGYQVSFDPSGGGPYSVNNLAGMGAVAGYGGRTVPPNAALLLARGWTGSGVRAVLESVVELDALPYAVAGTGSVQGNGLTVAGATSLQDFLSGSDKQPADVYGGQQVQLSGVGVVSGDVISPGQVRLGPGAQVLGKVKQGVAPVNLPNLEIASYDNSSDPGVKVLPGGSYSLGQPINLGTSVPGVHVLSGSIYVDGNLHLVGPVLMQNAYVFVNGNITVDGPITGTGTLFVTGNTSFAGGAVVGQGNSIAVFGKGNVDITLGGFFQGVLYSHQTITCAPGLTVLGAVMAQGKGASLKLGALSQVVHIPRYSAFASYWLGKGGGAQPRVTYWSQLQ